MSIQAYINSGFNVSEFGVIFPDNPLLFNFAWVLDFRILGDATANDRFISSHLTFKLNLLSTVISATNPLTLEYGDYELYKVVDGVETLLSSGVLTPTQQLNNALGQVNDIFIANHLSEI